MTARSSKVAVIALTVFTATAVQAQTALVLNPDHDTEIGFHTNYNSANTNYNTALHWSGISQPGASGGENTARGLMSFDLSSIPPDATVFGAFLSLFASGPIGIGDVSEVGSVGQNASALLRVTSSWNDNTVTWNTQPTVTNQHAVSLPQSTYTLQNYTNINVTELVQDMVDNPANSFGFMIRLITETPTRGLCFFGGLAPDPDKRPTLVVFYGECGSTHVSDMDGPDDHLTLSPNITSPGSTVRLDMGMASPGTSSLVLLNALGQIAYRQPVSQWPLSVTVPALAQGTYTWKVQDAIGNALGTARMVVQ